MYFIKTWKQNFLIEKYFREFQWGLSLFFKKNTKIQYILFSLQEQLIDIKI